MATDTRATTVPLQVEWKPAWLTWVAATTACLDALGVECDLADVAGRSGYAFELWIHEGLCPSGPTALDWHALLHGVHWLGRSTLHYTTGDCHTKDRRSERTRAQCRRAYEVVAREVSDGRPCVLWGAHMPEFAAVVGVEDGAYHVKSCRQVVGEAETPIPCEEVEAPGGQYVLAFPEETAPRVDADWVDRWTLGCAARALRTRAPMPAYTAGIAAYECWMEALRSGEAHAFGAAYNAQCWAEARALAHTYVERVAARGGELFPELEGVVRGLETSATALREVAALFPFPPESEKVSPAVADAALPHLCRARDGDAQALAALLP